MLLQELIAELESLPPDYIVSPGLTNPHSYRGFHEQLAFEPGPDKPAGEVLAVVQRTLGRVFHGHKGGTYRMNVSTPVWLARAGELGQPIVGVTDTLILGAA